MLISIGTYTLLYGWLYAIGFVGLLFVHEFGHYLQDEYEKAWPISPVYLVYTYPRECGQVLKLMVSWKALRAYGYSQDWVTELFARVFERVFRMEVG